MIYYLSVFFSILFILFIIRLVRKKKLEEKYSMMWLIAGIIILLVSLFPNIITKQNKMIVRLNQEVGILKEKLGDKESEKSK